MSKKIWQRGNISVFSQDKAYEAEKHHTFVRWELKTELIALLRRHGKKIGGFYRMQMKNLPSIYKKRASIFDNGHSILKGKNGDVIYAKNFRTWKIEWLGKILTYNLVKAVNITSLL